MRFLSSLIFLILILVSSWSSASAETGTLLTSTGKTETPFFSKIQKLKKPFQLGNFYEDDNIYRFVSRTTPLRKRSYTPENLVSISGAYIDEAGRRNLIRKEAKDALDEMAKAYFETFSTKLVVISAYRSANYQQRLWDLGKCRDSLCAPPGYSEHQLWLAVDLFDATTEADFFKNPFYVKSVAWLKENAQFYGFTQSYQKGEWVDEYEIEPWHWRYVGKDMATRLKLLWWTYTEYVRFQEAIQQR